MSKLKKVLTLLSVNDLSIGAFKSLSVRTASLLSGFILQIVLARYLSAEAFGDYTYVITFVGFIALFGKMGFDTASKRFIPKYLTEKKTEEAHQFLLFALIVPLSVSLLLIVFGEFILNTVDLGYSDNLRATLKIGWWLLPLLVLMNILVAQLESVKNILKAQVPFHIGRSVLLIISLLLFGFSFNTMIEAPFAMNLNAYVSFVITMLLLFFLKQAYAHRWKLRMHVIREHAGSWLSIALPLLLTAGLHLILSQADIIIIGYFLESEEVGRYAVALKLASLVLFGLTAVNVIAAPMISEYFTAQKHDKLQKMIALIIAFVFGMAIVLGTGLILFDDLVLRIYGPSFLAAAGALSILIVANIINTSTGPVSFVLTMTNYHMESLYILIIAAIINVSLNIVLIPRFGIEGAAYATLISTVIWNGMMYIVARNKLKLDTSLLSIRYLVQEKR